MTDKLAFSYTGRQSINRVLPDSGKIESAVGGFVLKARNLKKGEQITPPKGKLGVLIPGIGGAVSTTFIAGVELVRRGLAEPVGSLTQLGTIRLGKRFEHRSPKIKDFVPLADLDDLVFGGWDIYEANALRPPNTRAC